MSVCFVDVTEVGNIKPYNKIRNIGIFPDHSRCNIAKIIIILAARNRILIGKHRDHIIRMLCRAPDIQEHNKHHKYDHQTGQQCPENDWLYILTVNRLRIHNSQIKIIDNVNCFYFQIVVYTVLIHKGCFLILLPVHVSCNITDIPRGITVSRPASQVIEKYLYRRFFCQCMILFFFCINGSLCTDQIHITLFS